MASTRISDIKGPQGPEGPEGPAGPNSIPTAEFMGSELADPSSPAAVAVSAKIGSLSLSSFLSPTRVPGVTDDTAAIQAAVDAGAGRTLNFGDGVYRITESILVASDDTTIDARGAVIEIEDDGTTTGVSFHIQGCANFTWLGGMLVQPAASRSSVYGLLRVQNVDGVFVDALSTEGGSSAGVFVEGGGNMTFRDLTVRNAKADGLHLSRGAHDVKVISPTVSGCGDDGIGVVSVMADPGFTYTQVKRVLITDPLIDNLMVLGGGVAFVGAADCILRGGVISNVYAAGVKVTKDAAAGATMDASNISIQGTTVRNADNGFSFGDSVDCSVIGVQGVGNRDSGLFISAATRLLCSGGKFRGNAGFGAYEASGAGNHIIGADLRGNTAGALQGSSVIATNCITA